MSTDENQKRINERVLRNEYHYIMCDQCANHIPYDDGLLYDASCARCGHRVRGWQSKSATQTVAFTLSALILYVPALVFPFMTMEINGVKSSSTIWEGVVSLANSGAWFVAIVVFLASIFIPIIKLVLLFYLSLTASRGKHPRMKTYVYRFVEQIGRWSMLDIFLLAVLVAIMKLSPWTAVRPEMGSMMFACVVIFTMLASASFDPRLLWRGEYVEKAKN